MNYKTVPALAAYIDRVGAEQLNFRRFMIKVHRGEYYIERALIKIVGDGEIECSKKEFEPTKEESAAIKRELAEVEWPKTIRARTIEGLQRLTTGELYQFVDRGTGEIIMVQERRIMKDGRKAYLPWVMLSDGSWVSMEPDGALPFWKPPVARGSRIMVHEGAKAASFVTKLLSNEALLKAHPFGSELGLYDHWGMIGGALAPHRADYSELVREKPTEVVYVCDNDWPGKAALQLVSHSYGRALKGIMWGADWPGSFDLADEVPREFYKRGRYEGPTLASLIRPATWATENVEKKVFVLRQAFREEWLHCVTPEVFLHRDWPNVQLSLNEFNNKVAPFSDVDDTGRLLKRDAAGKGGVLRYNPGLAPGLYNNNEFINTHMPSAIESAEGDVGLFLEFMEHLIPDAGDRHEMLRWIATLVARPAVRMKYGVLLISDAQGVGKSTLGGKILAPLVGRENVSFPGESEIVNGNFNYWLAHKRLAVVQEIYAGHSSSAYDKLKSTITDDDITVSRKYMANYTIENWIHLFACSNSMRALKLDMEDRRWFVPRVTANKGTEAFWVKLNEWLNEGDGLKAIKFWAEKFVEERGGVVSAAAVAPWSSIKKEIIEEGYSPGQAVVGAVLDLLNEKIEHGEMNGGTFTSDLDLVKFVRDRIWRGENSDKLERPATLRKVAKAKGWHVGTVRVKVKGWGLWRSGGLVLAPDAELVRKTPGELAENGLRPLDLEQFNEL